MTSNTNGKDNIDYNYEKYNSNNLLNNNNNNLNSTKVKYYIKIVLKFAFSQIGLAGLVIGYVILGSLIFMKIESSYEKLTQEKIEINREEFYRDVRVAAEHIVNDYLRLNFHYKYNQYRNEEMNGNLFMGEEVSNNIIENSPVNSILAKKILSTLNDETTTTSNNNDNTTPILDNNNSSTTITTNNSSKKYKYIKEKVNFQDVNGQKNKKKNSWHVIIDEDSFKKEIAHYLKVFLNENDKIEDKDKTTLLREEVWTYSSSLLYSATVITTIGKFRTTYYKR
jgi:hypothetical protein